MLDQSISKLLRANLLHPATSVAAERDKHTQTDRNSGARHKIVEKNSPPAEANTSGEKLAAVPKSARN